MEEESVEPSYYEQMCSVDIIDPVLEAWSQGRISCDMDTKKFKLHREIGINRTWTFATVCQDRKCAKWLSIYHKFYKILSPPCKQCWKVVYAPQTLTELLDMQKFQAKLGFPGKCGIEARDYTSGLGGYRAFWYCPFYARLKGARIHFERIKKALTEHFGKFLIDNRIEEGRLFLKRGCTELERDFGPSDQWDKVDHSAKYNLLESVWEDPEEMTEEWTPLVYTNIKRWIEFAVAHNDLEALRYVKGKTLGVPSIKYHESEHGEDQFPLYMKPLNGTMEKKDGTTEEKEEGLFGFEPAESEEDKRIEQTG